MTEISSLIRALRGPLMLITVGTLFAVDHAGGIGFGKTWPVIIILYGALKLLERASGPPAPIPPAPPAGPHYMGPASGSSTWPPQGPTEGGAR